MQKTTTLALTFGLYEDLLCLLCKHMSSAPEFATRSVAALLAGTTEAILTPFERVQTFLQDHKHQDKFTNTYQAFQALRCHGIAEYYRGLVPILFRNGFSNVLFFGLRGPIKEHLPTATTHSAHLVNDFICGGVLGAMLGFLGFPVSVVEARTQSQIGGPFQSLSMVFKTVWIELDRTGQETDQSFQRCTSDLPPLSHLLGNNQCNLQIFVKDCMIRCSSQLTSPKENAIWLCSELA